MSIFITNSSQNSFFCRVNYSKQIWTQIALRLCFFSSLQSNISTIVLVRPYHRIPVTPENVPKTAVITPFDQFEFLRMPFGLQNAAQTFWRFIDTVLHGLDFVCAYIDDLLIASSSLEDHYKHLETVFHRLDEHGVVINPSKCQFGQTEVKFLGHLITSQGIRPLPSKVEAISNFPIPTSKRQLKRFLGMVHFLPPLHPRLRHCRLPLASISSGVNNKVQNLITLSSLSYWLD